MLILNVFLNADIQVRTDLPHLEAYVLGELEVLGVLPEVLHDE